MAVYLGNLTIEQVESRLGISLNDTERKFFNNTHQSKCANLLANAWHCYDIPFIMHCGSRGMAVQVNDILQRYADQCKVVLQIAIG